MMLPLDGRSNGTDEHPQPLRGCNSDLAQYSNTPSLRAAGFEDDDEDEDENEAPYVTYVTRVPITPAYAQFARPAFFYSSSAVSHSIRPCHESHPLAHERGCG